LERAQLSGKVANISNILETYKQITNAIQEEIENSNDLLLCIGSKGIGKSTLMATLAYGSQNMRLRKVER